MVLQFCVKVLLKQVFLHL